MMQYAININTVVPVRAEARESAEMVTQLLFGDICSIEEISGSFVKIINYGDRYEGWVDKKTLSEISETQYLELTIAPIFMTCVPIVDAFCLTDKTIYHLSAGSKLPFYDIDTNSFNIAGKRFQIHPSFVTYLTSSSKGNIIPTAMLFLNTPYLWGGKNIMGIDCSGFTQIVFSMNGYQLPRDASEQAHAGSKINTLAEAQASDLLFFEKQGKITHVGIYLGDEKIIHSSGKVKIDNVDEKGIYSRELSQYTHNLCAIKRI